MSEEIIIKQCAPTLAGIKTGSLFSCPCKDLKTLTEEIKEFNRIFVSRGLCMLPMRFENSRALLYLFRPAGLQRDLQVRDARKVLEQAGYPKDCARNWIAFLARRFREEQKFPHEVGLFLSYPPEDVKGFIDNQAANFKYSGIWKVYGDVHKARELFQKYKKCTEIYCRLWQDGSRMEQLVVSDMRDFG